MRVYRVEHKDTALGPYSVDPKNPVETNLAEAIRMASLAQSHPIPEEDPYLAPWCELSLKEQMSYVFGFESLTHLYAWFTERARTMLTRLGFHIVEFEANDTYIGTCQVVFNKETATLITTSQLVI